MSILHRRCEESIIIVDCEHWVLFLFLYLLAAVPRLAIQYLILSSITCKMGERITVVWHAFEI